jgi:hypothetical protein
MAGDILVRRVVLSPEFFLRLTKGSKTAILESHVAPVPFRLAPYLFHMDRKCILQTSAIGTACSQFAPVRTKSFSFAVTYKPGWTEQGSQLSEVAASF